MSIIEQIIRPFADVDATPTPFVQPATVGVPPALVKIGLKGGGQTFNGKLSFQRDTKLGAVHNESPSPSVNIQSNCNNAAARGSAIANGLS